MKDILLFTQFFLPDKTSTGKVLGELSLHLVNNNNVEVLSSRQSYNDRNNTVLKSKEIVNEIKITRVFSKFADKNKPIGRIYNYLSFFTLAAIKTLFNNLHGHKDILVSVSNPPIMPLLPALLKSKSQKFVYILHDLYPDLPIKMGVTNHNSTMSKVMFAVNRYVFEKADKVVVLGRDMKEYLHMQYQIPAHKLIVITNWADEKQVESVNFADERFKVIYSGNMGQFHSLEMLIRLAERHEFIDLEFIGEGAQKNSLMDMVKELKLQNVKFTPFLDEDAYIKTMSTANAFAVSLEKNLTGLAVPSKFYTYLSIGRPIVCIAEQECEMAMVVKENNCGIVIKHDDIDNLCTGVLALHSNLKIQLNMGKSAKDIFNKSYEKNIVMKQFDELFANL